MTNVEIVVTKCRRKSVFMKVTVAEGHYLLRPPRPDHIRPDHRLPADSRLNFTIIQMTKEELLAE